MKQRILVVEDEENIRDVCRRYMERDGYEFVMASDGQQCWDLFRECHPDLVVIDVMMPKKDGYRTLWGNSPRV